ncbi:mosc domain-containing protein [Colletotrichum karsti]|uniref:Mosc domain-containing protein n=1 Tax=Colletotrichum karsti TaxID=1095194 RepID=A0A9P6IF87_9PEZI|nr:mosc domain-containing protein [Colletotrichum karsti]KAF9881733.1 mosc domain-containing protein [Colletotrichum karsti]
MKIKTLNVYPIKALRPIPLTSATLTPQGILHDRTYMLFRVNEDSSLRKLQLSSCPQTALFSQEIVSSFDNITTSSDGDDGDTILVRYNIPSPPLIPHHPLQDTTLRVPLVPDDALTAALEPISIDLHGSPAEALRMGDPYDAFFSACLGFPTILVHIGSGRRPVLGTLAPGSSSSASSSQSLFSSIASYLPSLTSSQPKPEADQWLTFTDCAPYLVTSHSSLSHPSLAPFTPSSPSTPSPIMPKFRPNIVLEDPSENPFAEDFWAELTLHPSARKLLLTANCGRCSSLNVDYATGRPAPGPEGKLLNTLMKERRVDPGHKYAPIFGRYAFLSGSGAGDRDETIRVRVGDEVTVSRRNAERTVFDWPLGGASTSSTAAAAKKAVAVA